MALFSPEDHDLFTVVAGVVSGIPASIEAYRAGFCFPAAYSAFPKYTSSTYFASSPACSNHAEIVVEASLLACSLLKPPIKLPIGVRLAATIHTSANYRIGTLSINE